MQQTAYPALPLFSSLITTIRLWPGILLLGWCLGASAGLLDFPDQPRRVTDLTATLSSSQQQALSRQLQALEQEKGSQLAVLIVPTTGEESIEQFSMRVLEQWKLGRKDVDDGVLLLLAKDDRTLRIEVGYGLEAALSDVTAKRIIEEGMVPRLRDGDVYGAIETGVGQIIAVINDEPLPAPRRTSHSHWTSPSTSTTPSTSTHKKPEDLLVTMGYIAGLTGWVFGMLLREKLPSKLKRIGLTFIIATAIAAYLMQHFDRALFTGAVAMLVALYFCLGGTLAPLRALSRLRGHSGRSGSPGSSSAADGGSNGLGGGGGRSGGGGSSGRW